MSGLIGFHPAHARAAQSEPAPAPAAFDPPLPQADLQQARTASSSRPPAARSLPFRDVPAPPTAPPMADALRCAARACRDALGNVITLFDHAARHEPVPMSVAQDTAGRLVALAEDEPELLLAVVRLKSHDDYAYMHSVAVSALMAGLARQLGLDAPARRDAALAGLLHDIGKAFIPSGILRKPGRLTDQELCVVRSHPERGFQALASAGAQADAARDVALHHHERPDGRGYPEGLAAGGISRLARMGAVCDVYDAITSNRPYKDGWDPVPAMRSLVQWAHAGQFDTRVVKPFSDMMGPFPIGSLVRLRSQRLAVVNASTSPARSRLCVTAFYCCASQKLLPPEVVDLTDARGGDAIQDIESNAVWRFQGLDTLWAGTLAEPGHGARGIAGLASRR